jgi:hypothetical protein
MTIRMYNLVQFIGPAVDFPDVKENDIGAIIEDYGDGNYEVEFSDPPLGITRAQIVIPEKFLVPIYR